MIRISRITESTFIATAQHHAQIASTNDRALEVAAARDGSPVGQLRLPLLVTADRQTAGRGRGTKQWWNAPDSLAFSVLLDPRAMGLDPKRQSAAISTAAGLAVVDALRRQVPEIAERVRPKWPNDVLGDGRKLAGVLIEVPRADRLVIGIGVNVNAHAADAPADLAERITTVRDMCGQPVDREQLLIAILQSLETLLDAR
jgi:BirA family biotin operon repressor/biotin-[acetyl-CoA-carboxylase] ligase